MSKLLTILTVICSVPGLVGIGMLAGAMPDAEEKAKAIALWTAEFAARGLPLAALMPHFFLFVGTCKVSGCMAIHGVFGRNLELLANVLFIALCGCAYKQHKALELEDNGVPPLVFMAIFTLRLILSIAVGGSSSKNKTN
jgi:hypothetical protein